MQYVLIVLIAGFFIYELISVIRAVINYRKNKKSKRASGAGQ